MLILKPTLILCTLLKYKRKKIISILYNENIYIIANKNFDHKFLEKILCVYSTL